MAWQDTPRTEDTVLSSIVKDFSELPACLEQDPVATDWFEALAERLQERGYSDQELTRLLKVPESVFVRLEDYDTGDTWAEGAGVLPLPADDDAETPRRPAGPLPLPPSMVAAALGETGPGEQPPHPLARKCLQEFKGLLPAPFTSKESQAYLLDVAGRIARARRYTLVAELSEILDLRSLGTRLAPAHYDKSHPKIEVPRLPIELVPEPDPDAECFEDYGEYDCEDDWGEEEWQDWHGEWAWDPVVGWWQPADAAAASKEPGTACPKAEDGALCKAWSLFSWMPWCSSLCRNRQSNEISILESGKAGKYDLDVRAFDEHPVAPAYELEALGLLSTPSATSWKTPASSPEVSSKWLASMPPLGATTTAKLQEPHVGDASPNSKLVSHLQELARLRERGSLTHEEFVVAKGKLLGITLGTL